MLGVRWCALVELQLLVWQDTRFTCNVHPETIIMSAGLGGVTGIDASLEEGHPYRKACRPREGASTSLIQVDSPPPTLSGVAATLYLSGWACTSVQSASSRSTLAFALQILLTAI